MNLHDVIGLLQSLEQAPGSQETPVMPKRTVARVLQEYCRARRDIASHSKYVSDAKHLTRHLGSLAAVAVRRMHTDEYRIARLQEGASEKSIYNEQSLLRTACRYAHENDRIASMPTIRLKRPRSVRTRVAMAHEICELLQGTDTTIRRFILACYTCGLTKGDAINLQWSDFAGGRFAIIQRAKTREEQIIYPGERLWALMHEEPRDGTYVLSRTILNRARKPVCTGKWSSTVLQRHWDRARDGSDITIHDLRRSYATNAQELGYPERVIAAGGGWAPPARALTRNYLHPHRRTVAKLTQALEDQLWGSPVPLEPDEITQQSMAAQGLEPSPVWLN